MVVGSAKTSITQATLGETDTLSFELQPDEEEYGDLRNSLEYRTVVVSPYNSPFKISVTPFIQIHGHVKNGDESIPASLLVFSMVMDTMLPTRDHRIKYASVELEFEKSDDTDIAKAPEVVGLAPGRPPLYLGHSKEAIVRRSENEIVLGAAVGSGIVSGNAKGTWHAMRETTKNMVCYAKINAFSQPSDDRYPDHPNYATWFLSENSSQESAVPTDFSLAVLVTRTEGDFSCKLRIKLGVDYLNVRDWFTGYKKWNHKWKTLNIKTGTSREAVKIRKGDKIIESDSLEELLEGDNLHDFVYARMPPVSEEE